MNRSYFVTAIDTGIGKTTLAAILSQASQGIYWKPIQCGDLDQTDSDFIRSSTNGVTVLAERAKLKQPASPHRSAKAEGLFLSLHDFVRPNAEGRSLIVEGAGGLLVPLNNQDMMIDLIKKFELPAIVVTRHYLGSINHTLLTLEALKARNIPIKGLVVLGEVDEDNEALFSSISGVPILGKIPFENDLNQAFIQRQAEEEWVRELFRA